MTALLVGFGLGFFVGAQPGPVSLLCVRSVLRGAFTSGIAIGAGAAVVDLLYAALGLAGAASLLEIDALRIGLGVFGALVLAVIATRTLWAAFRVRLGAETPDEVATPRRACATTVASTAAVGAAASTAAGAALLLGGVGLGTLTAFSALTTLVTLVRSRFGPGLLATVDVVAGAGLLGFAGLVGWRTAQDS